VLYVYAFVTAPATVPDVPGVDGTAVRSEPLDGLVVVVSEHDGTVEASEAAILAHARVVEALAATNEGVLPARFGGMYGDETALREGLAGRSKLADALARVRGCVELGVRVLAEAAPPSEASSGGAYMRARLEQRRELERLADELHAPLAGLSRDATLTVGATPRLLLTAAYLVERGQVEAFHRALSALQSQHPNLGIVCTGPWPPYSFAVAEGDGS
jgi:Gas vesicle synthesis protein GvpL/GvpF